MSRLWIKDLNVGQTVEMDVCVLRGDVLQTRNGDDYLALTFGDRTDKISAKRWNPSSVECEAVSTIQFARISGKVELREEKLQVKVLEPLHDLGTPSNLADLLLCSPIPLSELQTRLYIHIESVHDPRLKALLEAVFVEDPKFSKAFLEYPAALGNHHAFRHGLLQHTLEVADIVTAMADKQQKWGGEPIYRDLAVAGALLHDIGKIEEMSQENFAFEFSDAGSLLGHVTLGTLYLIQKIVMTRKEKEIDFPRALEQMLLHLVCSHHGRGEWGSPKAPMTPEAVILHMADKMSADLFFLQEARAEANTSTHFVKQRKLESGFGGLGRFVFVGDMDALRPPLVDMPALMEPVGYPLPDHFSLPVLRLIDTDKENGGDSVRSLTLYGKIAAGQPLMHSDNQEGELQVDLTNLGKGRFYLLRVQGDSMTGDGIQDGDLVVVRSQAGADHGDLVVAMLDGEGATVKRLVRKKNEILLMPSNRAHPPIPVPPSARLDIQGRVVGIARRFND
jgi:3'-5' exoribonuclease